MIGRERHKLLQRGDQVIGDMLRPLVTIAAVDRAIPNRVERRAGAVALEPGKQRMQRGVVVWQMTALVDQRRALCVGDLQLFELLTALYRELSTSELRGLPALETLRQVWIQNFVITDGQIRWRESDNTPPAGRYS